MEGVARQHLDGGMEKPHLLAASGSPVEKLFGVQVKSDTHCGRPRLLARDGMPD